MNYFVVLFSSMILCSCASITKGRYQTVVVNTEPETGASCTLTNNKGTWHINSTPGTARIHKSFGDMQVVCRKGNKVGSVMVRSSTNGANIGNLAFGGLIGAGIDASTGAGYNYPDTIYVPLK